MDLPIDINQLTFICAGEPAPVVDYDSGRPKTDRTGTPLFQVPLLAMTDGAAEVLKVKVPGQPQGLTTGAPVRPDGLVSSPWTIGDNSGVAYRARTIRPATPTPSAKGGAA